MAEIFNIQHEGDHVHVYIDRNAEVDEHWETEYWRQLGMICKQNDTCRVLVEGFQPKGERTTTEVVQAGQRTAAIPKLWIAYCLEDWKPTEQSELYESIAASQGVRVKFFSNRDMALSWLRANAPK